MSEHDSPGRRVHAAHHEARPMVEAGDSAQPFEEPGAVALLWFGFLGGAIAWFLHLVLSYVLVGYACDYALPLLVHVPGALMLPLTAAAGWVSWQNWGRLGRTTEEEVEGVEGRSRFMAMSGLAMAGFFGLVIVAQWIPAFIMPPCY